MEAFIPKLCTLEHPAPYAHLSLLTWLTFILLSRRNGVSCAGVLVTLEATAMVRLGGLGW